MHTKSSIRTRVIAGLICLIIGIFCYHPPVFSAKGPTAAEYGVVLNLSGKQRMLTQKMSKEFLLIAYGHEVDNNKLNLLETYSLFERTLKGLLDGDEILDLPGTKNKKIRKQLSKVQGLWQSFKPVVEFGSDPKTTIKADKIKTLAASNLPLLKEMNKAVGMYEKETAGK